MSFGQLVAEVAPAPGEDPVRAVHLVRRALVLDRVRDIHRDPGYGVQQLVDIAWTSISTAKQSPTAGLLAIYAIRDLAARWVLQTESGRGDKVVQPVVYNDDVPGQLMSALESLAVVSSESMQAQCFAEVVHTVTLLASLPDAEQRERIADVVMRMLPALGDHVLTADLEDALTLLAAALGDIGFHEVSRAVGQAQAELATSVGRLNSRSTRVPDS